MKKHHILTLALILIASVGFGQYNLNYPDIKVGNSATGKIVLNGSNLQMPRIGLGSITDSVLTIVNGVVKKVPRSYFNIKAENGVHVNQSNGSVELGLDLSTLATTQNGLLTKDLYLYKGNPTGGNNKSLEITSDYISFSKQYNSGIQSIQFNDFGGNQMQVVDAVNNKGFEYNNDYSIGRTFPADNNWIPNAKYVNDAVTGAVSGNYIATNNGTGNNTALNTPSITNGSANNLTIGLTSPTTGRFTNLTATTSATVPTVATSDNSTNSASTAHVKANLANYAKLSGGNIFTNGNQNIIEDGDSAPLTITSPTGRKSNYESDKITFINENGAVLRLARATASTINRNLIFPDKDGEFAVTSDLATGQTIGASTTGNSATSTAPQNATSFKTALATSFQDVTNVNPGTTNTIQIKKNQGGVGIDITNETDATFKMGVTAAGASNMYGWVGSDVQGQLLVLNPDNNANVAIGKTTALAKLDVNGNFMLGATGSGQANGFTVRGSNRDWYHFVQTNGNYTFGANQGDKYFFTNDGKLGINQSTPTEALHVVGKAIVTTAPTNATDVVRLTDLQSATLQTVPVSGTSQAMSPNRVYIPHSASLTTFTLPTTATEGQLFQIVGEGSGGWRVSQNASQQVVGVNVATTSGTTGYVQSTNANCTITIRCTVANSKFTITSSQGTLTIN